MPEARARRAVLLLLLVLAVVTRFWGLGWGLPHTYHVDENRFTQIAVEFLRGDLNPHFFHVGSLHMYALAGMWKIYSWVGGYDSTEALVDALVRDPTPFYLIGRSFSAVLGVATVLLIYLLGLRMFGFKAGAAAGLFAVFSLEHVKISHAMLPDVPTVFFLVLTFYLAWRIYKTGRTRYYLLAGLTAGLAMAMKYAGHMMAIPVFTAHIAHVLEHGLPKKKILLHPPLYLFGLVFLATFVAGCPYAVLDFKRFSRDFLWQSRHLMTEGHFGASLQEKAWLFHLQYGFRDNLGLWTRYLAFLGTILALRARKARDILLLVYPLLMFVMIGMWKAYATRYFLPLAPFFLLLAGLAAAKIGQAAATIAARISTRWGRTPLPAGLFVGILAVVAVAPSALSVVRYDLTIAGPDTRTQAMDWVHWNIPSGSKVAIEEYDPPISRERYDTFYRHSLSEVSLEFLIGQEVRYVIINDIDYARFTDYPDEFPKRAAFYFDLDRQGTLLKTFRPSHDEDLIDLHNPTIKVYRLTQAPYFRFPGHFERFAAEVTVEKSAGDEWTLRASMRAQLGSYVGERVAEPYVLLRGTDGRELARLVLHTGPVPEGEFAAESSRPIPAPPEGAAICLGYLYDLAPNPLRVPPEQPFGKETTLPEKVVGTAGPQARITASFRYNRSAAPEPSR